MDREEWSEGAQTFRAFLTAHPDDPWAPEARFWAGFCLVKLGEDQKAVELLSSFLTALAADKWADHALLEIGKAFRGLGKDKDALAAWERHLEKYPQSAWRTEVSLAMIDVLFFDTNDLAACLAHCRRLTDDVSDRESTTEARYLGAYCLNALGKFDESQAWTDRWFDPESALEEAWRYLLDSQRDFLRGRADSALASIDSQLSDLP